MEQRPVSDSITLREQLNRIMKDVDNLIKQGKFREASTRLREAQNLAPDNPYVRAFGERITTLDPASGKISHPSPPPPPQASTKEEKATELQTYEEKRATLIRELEVQREILRKERETMLAESAENLRKTKKELRSEMDKKLIERLEHLEKDYARKIDLLGISAPKTLDERLALYRARLRKIYAEGEPTASTAQDLFALKELLELSYDNHLKLDTEVRLERYVQAVEGYLMDGTLTFENTEKLDELKQTYHIFPEESARLETYILSKIRQRAFRGTILLADDEEDIRLPIAYALEGQGYNVLNCASVADAISRMESQPVDIIVSDIKFIPGDADGFQFFQAVQKSADWRSIPFLFLSSLKDDVIIRSGMQLGVDDYLTKPVDIDLLIAVIEGKLKRHKRT